MKVPPSNVKTLAKQLELDPVGLLQRVLVEYDLALARNETFMTGFKLQVSQALDAQVMQELAYHCRPLARRDSEAARVSVELEELYARHAKERRAVRRLLLDSGSAGTGADS